MKLCQDYLSARGITNDTVLHYRLELDDRLDHTVVKNRLGQHFPKGVLESVWFPMCDSGGNEFSIIARLLPTIANHPKFLCPIRSGGIPYIPTGVYKLAYGLPLVVSEGPVKALVVMHAGVAAIGLNGVWGAGEKNNRDLFVIRSDLYSALDWRGRKVYIALDMAGRSGNRDLQKKLYGELNRRRGR
jgi:hypothetical protein